MSISAYTKDVGKRGVIFQFDDENLVYLIKGFNKLFLCDTHEGPLSMKYITDYINDKNLSDKDLYVFNSHSDFDHVWGNCVFDCPIIGHTFCRERLKERGEYDYEVKSKYHKGTVKLKLPDLIFNDNIKFAEEGIEFFHAPGHTIDSSICIDRKEKVAYVGDLVESPVIILLYHHLEQYLQSLSYIKDLAEESYTIISSHSGIVDKSLIEENISYLRNLVRENKVKTENSRMQNLHNFNKKNLVILKYERVLRDKSGSDFNYKEYKKKFWGKFDVKYENLDREYIYMLNNSIDDLERAMKECIAEL